MITLKLIQAGYVMTSRVQMRLPQLAHPISGCSSLTCVNEGSLSTTTTVEKKLVSTEKPKSPLKPFVRFTMKYRSLFKAKYPDANSSEIVKRLAMVWNQMSNDDRSPYFDSYAKESDEYYENLREYRIHFNIDYQKYLDEKMRKQRNREEFARKRMLKKYFKMPPKPVNGFLMFSAERKKEENVTTKTRQECQMWLTEMGMAWRKLPERQKQKYHEKYKELLGIYEDLTIEWEKEVVEAGYAFLLPEAKRIDFQPTNPRYRKKTKDELFRLQRDSIEEEVEDMTDVRGNESSSLNERNTRIVD